MEGILFYIISAVAVLCAVMVVANPFSKNPITSALFLVVTTISLAGLFVLLNAFFIAIVQILIYAGAVVVLFLFVLMLIDLNEEQKRRIKFATIISGLIGAGAMIYVIISALCKSGFSSANKNAIEGSPSALGNAFFSRGEFLLPFEIVSVLLLVAICGSIYIAAKDKNKL